MPAGSRDRVTPTILTTAGHSKWRISETVKLTGPTVCRFFLSISLLAAMQIGRISIRIVRQAKSFPFGFPIRLETKVSALK